MSTGTLIYIVACHVILFISASLVFHPRYEDGIFGRAGLGLMAIAALLVLIDFWLGNGSGVAFYVNTTSGWMATGMAVFLARHAWRFWQVRWRCPLKHGPYESA